MIVRKNVSLSSLTTLRVGGPARFLAECVTTDDVREALTFARERELPWNVLGEGSNVLALDEGFEGVVLAIRIPGITVQERDAGVLLSAGAGVSWDALVKDAALRGLWGLENLAGIPGTAGAAPVQNIGAYGTEVKDTLYEVHAIDADTGEVKVVRNESCGFGYRESRFKKERNLIIAGVSFLLRKDGEPQLEYKDLAAAVAEGAEHGTPEAIGNMVRTIRARKFPDLKLVGTAGSFFKNPTISPDSYGALQERYADIPGYPNEQGVKIPLAFVLDRALGLRGYAEGNVSLFAQQPLVLVAEEGATAGEVDAFADRIAARVQDEIGINIEREVQMFPIRNIS